MGDRPTCPDVRSIYLDEFGHASQLSTVVLKRNSSYWIELDPSPKRSLMIHIANTRLAFGLLIPSSSRTFSRRSPAVADPMSHLICKEERPTSWTSILCGLNCVLRSRYAVLIHSGFGTCSQRSRAVLPLISRIV